MASLIGFGLTSFTGSLRLESFGTPAGRRWRARRSSWERDSSCNRVAVMAGNLGRRLARRSASRPRGRSWAARRTARSASCGSREIVGDGLPPPAGDPQRRLEAGPGDDPLRASRIGRVRACWTSAGRSSGPGPDHLEPALHEILAGTTASRRRPPRSLRHPLRGRRARALPGRCPRGPRCTDRREPRAGGRLRRSTGTRWRSHPPRASRPSPSTARSSAPRDPSDDRDVAIAFPPAALEPVPGGWDGPARSGTVFLSTEYDAGWELAGDVPTDRRWRSAGRPASATDGEPVVIRHDGVGSRRRIAGRAADDPLARRALGDEEAGGSMRALPRGPGRGTGPVRARVRRLPGGGADVARSRRSAGTGPPTGGRVGAVGGLDSARTAAGRTCRWRCSWPIRARRRSRPG